MTLLNNNHHLVKYAAICVLLFVAVYFPPFRFFPYIEYLLIIGFIAWLGINPKLLYSSISTRPILFFLVTHILIIFYLLFREQLSTFPHSISFQNLYPVKQIRFLLNITFTSLGIAILLFKQKWDINRLLTCFIHISIVQSIFALAMFLLPSLRDFIMFDFLRLDSLLEEKEFFFAFRNFGISSEYLFTYPLFQGFTLIIIFAQALQRKYKFLVFIPLISLSILLNARIGFFSIPSFFIATFFLIFINRKIKIPKVMQFVKVNLATISIILVSTLFLALVLGTDFFMAVISFGFGGGGGSKHTDFLFGTFIIIPDTVLGFLLGEGRYLYQNDYEYQSDIGYINDLMFGGIIYIFLYLTNLLKLLFSKFRQNDYYIVIIVSSLILIVFAYIKGPILNNNGFMRAILILVFLNILNSKNESKSISFNHNSFI